MVHFTGRKHAHSYTMLIPSLPPLSPEQRAAYEKGQEYLAAATSPEDRQHRKMYLHSLAYGNRQTINDFITNLKATHVRTLP